MDRPIPSIVEMFTYIMLSPPQTFPSFRNFCVLPPINTLVSGSSHENTENVTEFTKSWKSLEERDLMCDVETFKNTLMLIVYSYKRMENTFLVENDDVTSMKFECHLR